MGPTLTLLRAQPQIILTVTSAPVWRSHVYFLNVQEYLRPLIYVSELIVQTLAMSFTLSAPFGPICAVWTWPLLVFVLPFCGMEKITTHWMLLLLHCLWFLH
jgi:hypothetical protein